MNNQIPNTKPETKKDNKWLLWGLIGFTGILLVTAIILFLQLKKPAAPLPTPRPKASPTLPTVKEIETENVCELTFSVRPKYCSSAAIVPSSLGIGQSAVFSSVSNPAVNYFTYSLYNRDNLYDNSGTPKPICVAQGGDFAVQGDCPTGTYQLAFIDTSTSLRENGSRTVNYNDIFVVDKKDDFGLVSNIQMNAYFRKEGGLVSMADPTCVAYIASTAASPSPSPEPTTCFDTCATDNDCISRYSCQSVSGTKRCVNSQCPEDIDCQCKSCWDKCDTSNDCSGDLTCINIPNTNDKRCVNSQCITDTDCGCEQAQVSPSPSASTTTAITYASPVPPVQSPPVGGQTKGGQPELPEAGIAGPAVLGVATGLLLILAALLF